MNSTITPFEVVPFGVGIDADLEEIRTRPTARTRPFAPRQTGAPGQTGALRPTGRLGQTGQPRTRYSSSRASQYHHQRRPFGGYGPVGPGVEVIADDAAIAGVPGPVVPGIGPPSEQIRWVQFMLNSALGSNLPTDGFVTPTLRAALRNFQSRQGLPVSGFVGPDTIAALQGAGAPRPDESAPGGEFELGLM
jgi:peptidoglycan hydrolase-like protein with peptidoglycan-binding domain